MTSIQLSMGIPSFSAEAPQSWVQLTDWAQLLEGRLGLAAAAGAVALANSGVTDLRMRRWPLPGANRERDIPALVRAVRDAVDG